MILYPSKFSWHEPFRGSVVLCCLATSRCAVFRYLTKEDISFADLTLALSKLADIAVTLRVLPISLSATDIFGEQSMGQGALA